MMLTRLFTPLRPRSRTDVTGQAVEERLIHWSMTDKASSWGRSRVRVRVQKEPRVGMATFDEPWAGPRSGYVALAEWLMRKDRPRW